MFSECDWKTAFHQLKVSFKRRGKKILFDDFKNGRKWAIFLKSCVYFVIIMVEKRSLNEDLTDEEKARYDRQIRVWGSEAQARIQSSRLLVCGMRGINMEVIKNIVLAGMSICVNDSGVVAPGDLGSSGFFVRTEDLGKNMAESALPRIQELNNFANVSSETRSLEQLEDSFFQQFNIISLTNASEQQISRISAICRAQQPQIALFANWAFGSEGVFISDFGDEFQFKDDERPNTDFVPSVKCIGFPSLQTVLDIPWSKQQTRFLPVSAAFVKSAILAKWSNGLLKWAADATPVAIGRVHSDVEDNHEAEHVGDNHINGNTSARREHLHQVAQDALIANGLDANFLTSHELDLLYRQRDMPTSTVCSILGSFLAQEIVKCVSKVGEPAYNTHVYFPGEGIVSVYPMTAEMTAPKPRDLVPLERVYDDCVEL